MTHSDLNKLVSKVIEINTPLLKEELDEFADESGKISIKDLPFAVSAATYNTSMHSVVDLLLSLGIVEVDD